MFKFDLSKPFWLLFVLVLILVGGLGFYKYYSYHTHLRRNLLLQSINQTLGLKVEELKQKNIQVFKMVPYTSALLDYRLKMLPGIDITYTNIEDKDDCLLTYKSIVYKSNQVSNILAVIEYIQNKLLHNHSIIYLLDIKQDVGVWTLVIDFYSIASKLVK